jgi:colanic acid/amylovoran biosynthesis glycosyltransferase
VKRPLRIALFVGTFPAPSETFIARQAAGLLELGHEVDIYADLRGDLSGPRPPEMDRYQLLDRTIFMDLPPECAPWELPAWPEDGETWIPGSSSPLSNRHRLAQAEAVRERCRLRHAALTKQMLDPSEYGYRALSLSALHRLDRISGLARAGHYDVAHAHFGPVGESFRFTRELWQVPYLVSFHGYDFCTVPRREGPNCYGRLFQTADLVTVNSHYTWSRVQGLGCPETKLRKLPMGFDTSACRFSERQGGDVIRLITVARLVPIKGHEYCLRAVAEARARFHLPLQYDLIGEGDQRGKLENLVRELGLQQAVTFHGAQSGAALDSLLAQAHLGLLCSVDIEGDQEGQGLALVEAQACGLPVIATHHGGLPESILEGESGWLVPERNVTALANQIAEAVRRSAEWPGMGRRGREWVEQRFNIRTLNKQLADLYETSIMAGPVPHK